MMHRSKKYAEFILLFFLALPSSAATIAFATPPATQESYLIPNFVPEEGKVVQSDVNFRIHDADVMLLVGNTDARGSGEYHIYNLYNISFLRTGEGRLTRYDIETMSAVGKLTVTYYEEKALGPKIDAPFHSSLEGRTVRFTLEENGWKRSMIGTAPSPKQKEEMKNLEGWLQNDWNLPEEGIVPGHTWTFDASPLFQCFFGKRPRPGGGDGSLLFEETEELEGEQCARIGIKANGIFEIKEADGRRTELQVAVLGKLYISLASGLEKKIFLRGKANLVYERVDIGNSKVRMGLTGPMEFISLSHFQD